MIVSATYKGDIMSAAPSKRPKVPEGRTRFLTTTQNKPNEKGFVGYTVTWDAFQKEVPLLFQLL